VIARVHHVLEHGRARRQVRRVQEQSVKRITTSGWTVDGVAAFEDARVVFGVVHADQRSVVVKSLAAPVVELAILIHIFRRIGVVRGGLQSAILGC